MATLCTGFGSIFLTYIYYIVAPRFKPWNLRVCLKRLRAQCSILRTVFEFNLRFFFPDLATIWDDSKIGIKITLWLGC